MIGCNGYCITFKMKFETKRTISVKTQKTGLSHFQSSPRAEKQKSTSYLLKKKLFLIVLLDHDKTFKRYFHVFFYYLHTVLENTAFRLIMKLDFQKSATCSVISSGMLDSTNRKKKVYNYISYTANMSFSY